MACCIEPFILSIDWHTVNLKILSPKIVTRLCNIVLSGCKFLYETNLVVSSSTEVQIRDSVPITNPLRDSLENHKLVQMFPVEEDRDKEDSNFFW